MLKSLLLVSSVFVSGMVSAQTISLEYQGFYNHLKKANKGNFNLIEIAFSVPNKPACQITKGTISTESKQLPLTYTKTQRLYIPYDDQLKHDRALINLDIKGDTKDCGIAVQVQTRTNTTHYTGEQLNEIELQMTQLLKQMQGFPMRYFSDDIKGLTFKFAAPVTIYHNQQQLKQSQLQLSQQQIADLTQLNFSDAPMQIVPWVK